MVERIQRSLLPFAIVVLAASGAVFAQDALETQLATAVQHAEFSMGADDMAMAVRHLGHVLNCIAGEGGEGFDGSWGHPCDGQGAGIVSDIAGHAAADDLMAVLRSAHGLAMEGVEAGSLGAVQAAAAGVRALLMVIQELGG
jgi:hypothetical protein